MSRAKIETALINSLSTLPPQERGTVAGFILRPGFRIRYALYNAKPGQKIPGGPPFTGPNGRVLEVPVPATPQGAGPATGAPK
jgi:hypothetical protein